MFKINNDNNILTSFTINMSALHASKYFDEVCLINPPPLHRYVFTTHPLPQFK